jgi:hypothetical protein
MTYKSWTKSKYGVYSTLCVQVARQWKFLKSKAAFRDIDMLEELPRAKAADLAAMLSTKGF